LDHAIAARLEIAPEQILPDIGPEIADVGEVVNRRTAGVHADLSLRQRSQILLAARVSIVEADQAAFPEVVSPGTDGPGDGGNRKERFVASRRRPARTPQEASLTLPRDGCQSGPRGGNSGLFASCGVPRGAGKARSLGVGRAGASIQADKKRGRFRPLSALR